MEVDITENDGIEDLMNIAKQICEKSKDKLVE